jgi:hypothetical protein
MSLNGLDSPELIDAFEKACAEPGGWYVYLKMLFSLSLSCSRELVSFLLVIGSGLSTLPETMSSFYARGPMAQRRCEKLL